MNYFYYKRYTVHPHACGENSSENLSKKSHSGSPPRVWGKRLHHPVFQPDQRFTPTRVGKTYGLRRCRRKRTVHPHACGENGISLMPAYPGFGSPPRVWGKLLTLRHCVHHRRFTPTRVGKTQPYAYSPVPPTVHPHACGENQGNPVAESGGVGSPPRVWGKLLRPSETRWRRRFTPTRVGKTSVVQAAGRSTPVHPHACGENRVSGQAFAQVLGSPPRVWGKRKRNPDITQRLRFTPTRVGKTQTPATLLDAPSVHPHACGENRRRLSHRPARCGSPPRVWGKRQPERDDDRHRGFTPTRVGKTCRLQGSGTLIAVHPHACGENQNIAIGPGDEVGSPPRVWGKHTLCAPHRECFRFTPTRVGKTDGAAQLAARFAVHPHACGENTSTQNFINFLCGSPPRVWGKREAGQPS